MKIRHLSSLTLLASAAIALGTTPVYGESSLSSEKTFSCQASEGVPTTIVKTSTGETQPIFHWKSEVLPSETNTEQLCTHVSQQLENYLSSDGNLSSVSFKSAKLENIPAICLAGEDNNCNVVLLTLAPVEKPIETANQVLNSILDPKLQTNKFNSSTRGVQSVYYKVNFWQLIGLKFIK